MEELNSGPPKTNPSSGREEDLNPGPPDYKSSALPLGHEQNQKHFLCPQQTLRARANGETFVSATMCPQQCVLVCQGLKIRDFAMALRARKVSGGLRCLNCILMQVIMVMSDYYLRPSKIFLINIVA